MVDLLSKSSLPGTVIYPLNGGLWWTIRVYRKKANSVIKASTYTGIKGNKK